MFVAETQTEVHATHPNLDILIIYIEIHVENKHSVLSNKMKQCNVIFIYLKSENQSKDGANTDNRMIKKINRERKIERQYAMKIKNKATRITV